MHSTVRNLIVLTLLIFSSSIISEAKIVVAPNNRSTKSVIEDSSLTVYNQNRALIKQKRKFNLEKGINRIDWENLASTIDIHSVNLRNVDPGKTIEVKEQTYKQDLISPSSILSRSGGKTVYFRRLNSDARGEEQSGILVNSPSSVSDCVIKVGDHYVLNPQIQVEVNESYRVSSSA